MTQATAEEENLDPHVFRSPTKSSNQLKRKSRLISKRRSTHDDDSNEAIGEEDSTELIEDISTDPVLPKTLHRRVTRSVAVPLPFRGEDENVSTESAEQEATLEDSMDVRLVEHEKRKRMLRRGSKAPAALKNFSHENSSHLEKPTDLEDNSKADIDATPQVAKLLNNRKPVANKRAFLSQLDKIKRAPTPMKEKQPVVVEAVEKSKTLLPDENQEISEEPPNHNIEGEDVVVPQIEKLQMTKESEPVAVEKTVEKTKSLLRLSRNSRGPATPLLTVDSLDDGELTPQIEKLKMNRKSVGNKTAFLSALNNIQRAPTPMKDVSDIEGDFRRAAPAVDVAAIAEEADFSFHPNIGKSNLLVQNYIIRWQLLNSQLNLYYSLG